MSYRSSGCLCRHTHISFAKHSSNLPSGFLCHCFLDFFMLLLLVLLFVFCFYFNSLNYLELIFIYETGNKIIFQEFLALLVKYFSFFFYYFLLLYGTAFSNIISCHFLIRGDIGRSCIIFRVY